MNNKKFLDYRVKLYWFMGALISNTIIISIEILFILLAFIYHWDNLMKWILIVILLLTILWFGIEVLFVNKYKYKLFNYKFEDLFVEINKGGKLVKTQTVVPINEIYYVEINTNILMAKYDICTLQLGTIANVHDIEGISIKDAYFYRKILKNNEDFKNRGE